MEPNRKWCAPHENGLKDLFVDMFSNSRKVDGSELAAHFFV
jgi:hypothetical protein